MSVNVSEIELKSLLNPSTAGSSDECIDSNETVPETQIPEHNALENDGRSIASSEIDQLSENDVELLPIATNQISLDDGDDQSLETGQPSVNEGEGLSMVAQNVVTVAADIEEDEERPSEFLQDEVNAETEEQQKVNLDLSPLKWQDALLVAAVNSGSCENVLRNLQNGASPRSVDHSTGLSCAQLATTAGNGDILKMLLHHCALEKHNAEVFELDSSQKTLLHLAIEGKHYECLQILVAKGEVSRVDKNGESPLYAAVKISWTEGVRLLLSAGADVKGRYGEEPQKTVLHLAVLRKDLEVLAAIITEVTRLNDCDGIINAMLCDETPLFMAVNLEWAEAARLLLVAGAEVKGKYGEEPQKTILHLAVQRHDLEILKAIVTAMSRLNNVDKIINTKLKNETALFMAVKLEWTEAVRLLLDASADLKGKYGQTTLLQYYVVNLTNVEILEVIVEHVSSLENCAEIIDAKIHGETPLFASIRKGKLEYVQALIGAGANVMVEDNKRQNLLHCAAFYGQIEVLKILFEKKPTEMEQLVDKREGKFQLTPLQMAVKEGRDECVKFLIKKWTANDFGVDTNGCNLLQLASESYNQEVMDIFITNLYKPNDRSNIPNRLRDLIHQTSKTGDTPLLYALKRRQSEFVIALILSGSDLTAKSKEMNDRTAIDILIHTMPGSVKLLTDVMDRSISKPKNGEFVNVRYRMLMPYKGEPQNKCGPDSARAPGPIPDPDHGFGVVNALRETGNVLGQRNILEHPLVASYLYEHWRIIRGPYMTLVVLSYIFAICLSLYIAFAKPYLESQDTSPSIIALLWVLVVVTVLIPMILIFLHELQCIGNLRRWTYRFESCVKFICFAMTVYVFFPNSPPECAAFVILLANFELIVITSRIPGWGLYMLMFIEVTMKYMKLLSTFILIILGFSVAFMVTFRSTAPFETIPWSIMKTVVMMTNEFEYNNLRNFTSTEHPRLSPWSQLSAMTILILFIISVSFVLTNVLVAVAVIKVNKLHRISKQVDFLSNFWQLLLHPPKWLPRFGVMQSLFKFQQIVRRNLCAVCTNETNPAAISGQTLGPERASAHTNNIQTSSAQTNSTQTSSAQTNSTQTADAESNSAKWEAGCNEIVENRTINMNKKSGSTYKRKLYRELVLKGIEDRERLTKMYQEKDDQRKREKSNGAL